MALNPKRAAMVGIFAVATIAVSGIAMVVTSAGASAWRELIHVSPTTVQRRLGLGVLAQWRDLRTGPPPGIQGLQGQGVRIVGLLRPEPDMGGAWLVGEALALNPEIVPPHWAAVWIDVRAEDRHAMEGMRGRIVKARGTLTVGAKQISQTAVAAYVLELGTLSVRDGHAHHRH